MLVAYEEIVEPESLERRDVLFLPYRQHTRPRHAVDASPACADEDQDQVSHALSHDRNEEKDEDDLREGHEYLGNPEKQLVDDAALVAPVAAEEDANEGRSERAAETDKDGDSSAVKDPREDIPSEFVGAEKMRARRRPQDLPQIELQRSIMGDERGQKRGKDDDGENHESEQGKRIRYYLAQEPAAWPGLKAPLLLGRENAVHLSVEAAL